AGLPSPSSISIQPSISPFGTGLASWGNIRWSSVGEILMIHFPILRWGQPYKSLEVDQVVHFGTGEPLAEVSQANGGLVARDMRLAQRAREVLREIPCA